MHFASHLRNERLGEFTVGTPRHRFEPLAITQPLVLYQLVTARAAIAVGAEHARTDRDDGAVVAAPAAYPWTGGASATGIFDGSGALGG